MLISQSKIKSLHGCHCQNRIDRKEAKPMFDLILAGLIGMVIGGTVSMFLLALFVVGKRGDNE